MKLSYANVTSSLALVLALGTGGAVAGSMISGDDVKPRTLSGKHVKKRSLGSKVLRAGAVTGKEIKDGSLTLDDIASAPLPKITARWRPSASCAGCPPGPTTFDVWQVECLEGEVALGGGTSPLDEGAVLGSYPIVEDTFNETGTPVGWTGRITTSGNLVPGAYVICAASP